MRLVLDTNIIISAALWGGVPRRVLKIAYTRHTLCFSLSTLQELQDVLHYPKFSPYVTKLSFSIDEFLGRLVERGFLITDPHEEDIIIEDPADNKFLACAYACEAKLIVSGDAHLLKLKTYRQIPIVSAQTALRRL